MKRKTLSLLMFSVLLVALSIVPVQAQTTVVLGLCIDGSSSITTPDFTLMKNGIANAIINNLPHDATVELCVIQFSSSPNARIEVPPTIIDSDSTANTVATAVLAISQIDDYTATADGLWLTWDTMKTASTFGTSDKQIINLATDGVPNELVTLAPGSTGDAYDDVEMVVGWAVAEGLDELDAEAIDILDANVIWLRDDVVYPTGYEAPTMNPNPYDFDGDGSYDPGWVRRVETFEEFAATIGEKFEVIVPPEEHDVVAVSQSVIKVEVLPGELIDIDVTVRNDGVFTESFDVTCTADGITVGTIRVIDLAPGETRVLTFTWDTTGVPQGVYSITAFADSSAEITEVDETNNECKVPTNIFVIPEVPLGTVVTVLSMFIAFVGFVGFKRFRRK